MRIPQGLLKHLPRILKLIAGAVSVIMPLFIPSYGIAAGINPATPEISIIIDDIGYRLHDDRRAMALPGSLAYAIMPMSPHAKMMSRLATEHGKTVLLHLPMQAINTDKNRFLGPGALKLGMSQERFIKTLNTDLRSLPDAIGVNNHMGSLLTQYQGQMEWLMKALHNDKKFYIDSMTIHGSIAGTIARENRVPCLRRDVFLDNKLNPAYIKHQFEHLAELAKLKGTAVAIGHPHPQTIRVLMQVLSELDRYGVVLVSLPDMLKDHANRKLLRHISMSDPIMAGAVQSE